MVGLVMLRYVSRAILKREMKMKWSACWWCIIFHCLQGNLVVAMLPTIDPYFETIYKIRVSAHCLIQRDGHIVQYVSFNDKAWHAGISSYQGRERCNDFSIGIELEGTDDIPYTKEQYQQLSRLSQSLIGVYPELKNHIVGHCDIAPGRKTDPGASFDWRQYRERLTE